MNNNTLFYSNYCNHCKNFIYQLKQNGLLNYFDKKICIDNPSIRKNLPPFLKEIPTIITEDYNEPLASDHAFKWITFKIKEKNSKTTNKSNEINSNEIKPQNNLENNYFSDNYGSLSDNTITDPNTLKREGNSFIDYDSYNITQNAQPNNTSQSNESFDKRLEKIQKMRELDNNLYGNGDNQFRQG